MPKKKTKTAANIKEALSSFDLKSFKKWIERHNPPLFKSFSKMEEETQMGSMCKMICDRKDLLGTDCHKKAVQWLKEHNMRGRLF